MACNNLACYYKKRGQLRTALTYLERALDIESKFDVYAPDSKKMHADLVQYKETLEGIGRHEFILRVDQYKEKVEQQMRKKISASNKAETHLNTCAVLSQLTRHDLALQHANQAIIIIQTRLLFDFLPVQSVPHNRR
jgi:tetratricopeptide (TPR) repeat protein